MSTTTKRICRNCQQEFDAKREDAECCGGKCRVAWHRKQEAQEAGKKIPEKIPAGQPEKRAVEVPAMAAPIHDVVSKVPAAKKIRVRIWPEGMKLEEVKERLYRMRDYNATMRKQGTPQYCSDEKYVMARLEEALADVKLARIVFGGGEGK